MGLSLSFDDAVKRTNEVIGEYNTAIGDLGLRLNVETFSLVRSMAGQLPLLNIEYIANMKATTLRIEKRFEKKSMMNSCDGYHRLIGR